MRCEGEHASAGGEKDLSMSDESSSDETDAEIESGEEADIKVDASQKIQQAEQGENNERQL